MPFALRFRIETTEYTKLNPHIIHLSPDLYKCRGNDYPLRGECALSTVQTHNSLSLWRSTTKLHTPPGGTRLESISICSKCLTSPRFTRSRFSHKFKTVTKRYPSLCTYMTFQSFKGPLPSNHPSYGNSIALRFFASRRNSSSLRIGRPMYFLNISRNFSFSSSVLRNVSI